MAAATRVLRRSVSSEVSGSVRHAPCQRSRSSGSSLTPLGLQQKASSDSNLVRHFLCHRSSLTVDREEYVLGSGEKVTVSWDIQEDVSSSDWIGLFLVGESPWLSVCHLAFFNNIWNIGLLKKCLVKQSQLYKFTANKDIAKLQRVQNCLASVVTRSPRFSRSVPLLKSLHWLPVHYCIIFKICTIAYRALSSTHATSISKFNANSSKKFQTATLNH